MFDKDLVAEVGASLFRRLDTLAVAESVTAGLLQAAMASAENASIFFQGGITVYNARQKYLHLDVDIHDALSSNSVSDAIAQKMALQAAKIFRSDWGIGITGYASALPGHDMDPLFANFAMSYKNEIIRAGVLTAHETEPAEVQTLYVNQVLAELAGAIREIEKR
ncbi:MAG: CinA domain protein [Ferruginibacter sp.]|nr:CinA domain protein [Ferruginibacter sp.]